MNFQPLTDFIDSLYQTEGIPSSQIVVHQNGMELYRHSAGYLDVAAGAPIRQDALYNIYSVSKVITVIAAMQLYEQGKFRMDDPVGSYIPAFQKLHTAQETLDGSALKIFHLFTMTSGLDYALQEDPAVAQCIQKTGGNPTTAELVDAMAKRALLFRPGTQWRYGLSHDILARLVEVISGMRFSEYVQKNIFAPVGMVHSGYHLTAELEPRMASQYRFENAQNAALPITLKNHLVPGKNYESGGAGVISCMDDLILLADAMTNRGTTAQGLQILRPETVELIRTDCLDALTRPSYNWIFLRGYGYGYGVRTLIAPEVTGNLSSIGEFGWGGAAGSYFHADPERGVSIIYMQHMLNNKEAIVHPRIRNLVYSALSE